MHKRGEIVAILLLVILIILISSLSQQPDDESTQKSPTRVIRSSYRTFPEGCKALYLTLKELGYPVERQIRPLTMLPPQGFLIVSDPYRTGAKEFEGKKLLEWIKNGNYALISIEFHQEFLQGLEGDFATKEEKNQADSPLDSKKRLDGEKKPAKPPEITARCVGDIFLAKDAPTLQVRSSYRFPKNFLPKKLAKMLGEPKPIYRDKKGIVAAYSEIGKGGIVWCCSPWSFSNEGLEKGKNLDFLLVLASRQPGAPVIFDEFHHGYGANMSLWDIAPRLTKLGIVQFSLAIVLLFMLLAWRFGKFRLPAEERFTRSRAEYLTSMADLLQRAHSSKLALERLGYLLRKEIGVRLGLPLQSTMEQMMKANSGNPVVDQALLGRVMDKYNALEAMESPRQEEVFRLSVEIHSLLQRKMGTGTNYFLRSG